jgi:hypothetical protein
MSLDDFLIFLDEWFRGPTRIGIYAMRYFGLVIGDMEEEKKRFERDSTTLIGFEQLYWPRVKRRFRDSNLFMSPGYWETGEVEPRREDVLYDRLTYDFDDEQSPQRAVEVAEDFVASIKKEYGADAVMAKSGFKGAHVHVPLRQPICWEDYQVLWKALLRLLPEEKRQLCDYNMLEWNRLSRIPMTVNYKNGRRSWAWIIRPRVRGWLDFGWCLLEPLDPTRVGAVKVRIEIPSIRRCYVDLSRDNRGRYEWIEKVVEKGLPDGRKRFMLYALSAYLMNVKGLSEEEALQVVREFLENSCKNFGRRDEVYESFIRGDLRRVRSKGLRPAPLEKVREKDPELYSIVERVLSC